MISKTVTRTEVSLAVRRTLLKESRIRIHEDQLNESEPLRGSLLNINSLGFVGVLISLEDELDLELPDDLFVGKSFSTVGDVVDIVNTVAHYSEN